LNPRDKKRFPLFYLSWDCYCWIERLLQVYPAYFQLDEMILHHNCKSSD
jgi:hypothetical protein